MLLLFGLVIILFRRKKVEVLKVSVFGESVAEKIISNKKSGWSWKISCSEARLGLCKKFLFTSTWQCSAREACQLHPLLLLFKPTTRHKESDAQVQRSMVFNMMISPV